LAFTLSCSGSDDGDEGSNSGGSGGGGGGGGGGNPNIKYGSLTYEGKTYNTVKIGEQTWMAENLNYEAKGSKCYGEDGRVMVGIGNLSTLSPAEIQANCTKYGRLYDWATAMDIDAKYNEEAWGGSDAKHQGLCPSGWHISSKADWEDLMRFVNGGSWGSKKLKATSGWNESSPGYSGNGTDEFGFKALPGGYSCGIYAQIGEQGSWHIASERHGDGYAAQVPSFLTGVNSADLATNAFNKSCLFSIRCVQN